MSIVDDYVAEAAKLYGVTADAILGPSRYHCDVMARRHVMKQLRLAHWTCTDIGLAFNRHHSSVSHLTEGLIPPPPVRDNRPKLPAPRRVSAKATPEQAAEIHQRRYERTYRLNAVQGSRALLERQIYYGQYPARLQAEAS